ncbi:MAG: hypothetical protein ISR76_04470 [Planctomycetes bacterium]|nr:hypothetical protein [Planctomycetota bacterium]
MNSISTRSVRRALALPCLLLLALPLSAQQAWDGHPGVRFDDQQVIFDLEGHEPLTLAGLVELASELTGTVYSAVEASGGGPRSLLESRSLDLVGELVVPRADFRRYFHDELKSQGIVALGANDPEAPVARLILNNVQSQDLIQQSGVHLSPEQVRARADESMLYVFSSRRLKYGQAQSLGVNLRTALMSSGGDPGSLMPLPNENALLVRGFAPWVAQALDLLDELDVPPEVAPGPRPPADLPPQAGVLDERVALWALLAASFLLLIGNRLGIQGIRRDLRRLAAKD